MRLMATLLARAEPLILLTMQELAVAQPQRSGMLPAVGSGRGEPGAAGQQS